MQILDYLDDTLHPVVSPDNWNVYADIHDMVSELLQGYSSSDTYTDRDRDSA